MTAHREEHEHPLGKIVGTLARGVTADWMGVALVITHAGRPRFLAACSMRSSIA